MTLTSIAFDIETTGFETDDQVTVAGFALPLGCRVFVQTNGREVDPTRLQQRVSDATETTVDLSLHESEAALLAAVTDFGTETLAEREYLLVAYNGERYRGGFDLPFLRTRYARHAITWPFEDLPYADLMPLIQHRFNTTDGSDGGNTLETAYKTLVRGDLTDQDPFEDSSAAVEAFQTGNFARLVQHNVADIRRTKALAAVAERYCGKSDFDLKSLTPTVDEA